MVSDLAVQAAVHVKLCLLALAAAAALGVPLGALSSQGSAARGIILPLANLARVIPPLAVLTFVLPVLGVGTGAALVALVALATPPVIIATDVGFRTVPAALREAAAAMGMRRMQALTLVEWPLARPLAIAGLRTAAVEVVASTTIASFIGAGGLGVGIQQGLSTNQPAVLWSAVALVAALAFAAQAAFTFALRRPEINR